MTTHGCVENGRANRSFRRSNLRSSKGMAKACAKRKPTRVDRPRIGLCESRPTAKAIRPHVTETQTSKSGIPKVVLYAGSLICLAMRASIHIGHQPVVVMKMTHAGQRQASFRHGVSP